MRSSKTFSILFWIYTSRAKNNETRIYARITINGEKANISLKRKADIRTWDSQRQRAKGNNETSRVLNHYLDQIHAQLIQCYQEIKFSSQLVTAELIKSKFLGEGDNSKTLQEALKYHKRKIEKTLTLGTVKNFGVTEKYINSYLRKNLKTNDIYLKQLNYKFLSDFETFLITYYPKGHPKAMGNNTVMKHIQRLRKIITLAYHIEWIDKDPFVRWKPSFESTQREFLSTHELFNLENYKFPLERLDRVRDLFVFSCYTGISYTDIIKLTSDNIVLGIDGNKWIISKRQKTNTPIKVPLLQQAEYILEKYTNHPVTMVSETLLPVITNEKINLYLKEIADAVGIRKNLTFHMARHTFATTVTLSNGVPIETVSKLLGHTKLATTQIYARVLDKKISEDVLMLKKKLANQN
ncbi:site-specific integrase [Aquimarina algicola]|uniref:Site-specific integrase n=1 Tax=Aquimarina algicola TaxID=2589995 RepID=A0A504J7M6_9FLAO|nr:site-specific integrase [Aquimarina algicola]TPN84532.1 site-specific integrase [Aquimarina algicola]